MKPKTSPAAARRLLALRRQVEKWRRQREKTHGDAGTPLETRRGPLYEVWRLARGAGIGRNRRFSFGSRGRRWTTTSAIVL
ncbi:MAG: hypothetical protein D6679_06755 [Candidatus Hydrogenedentota bacterium]|nr:MAG: hypothetical protein D6679_06755 [Candidatus Hydrogenedentota bacterium]